VRCSTETSLANYLLVFSKFRFVRHIQHLLLLNLKELLHVLYLVNGHFYLFFIAIFELKTIFNIIFYFSYLSLLVGISIVVGRFRSSVVPNLPTIWESPPSMLFVAYTR